MAERERGKRSRGNGEGSIYQRSDGTWCASLTLDFGRRRVFYGRTRKEAADKLADALKARKDHLPLPTERLRLGQFLDQWLEQVVRPKLRPLSYIAYKAKVDRHIKPVLGNRALVKLTPQDVQILMNQKQAEGLSPRMVREIRGVLRTALNRGVKWGLVARNVASLTDPPMVEHHEIIPLDVDQAKAFLEAARGDRLEALYTVAVALGLRQGEALGLRWVDVDLDDGVLRVRKQLQRIEGTLKLVEVKTAKSRRLIDLPTFAVNALRDHRRRQLEERLHAGARWQDSGLVFTTTLGTPLDARNVVRRFHLIREKVGLKSFRFHDTRHTCATLLLAQGVQPRVIMEILGHSQIGITMNLYAHVLPTLKREAAEKMDAVFGASV